MREGRKREGRKEEKRRDRRSAFRPVILYNTRTGDEKAGFMNQRTGKLEDAVEIHTACDIDRFMDYYGIGVITRQRVS